MTVPEKVVEGEFYIMYLYSVYNRACVGVSGLGDALGLHAQLTAKDEKLQEMPFGRSGN